MELNEPSGSGSGSHAEPSRLGAPVAHAPPDAARLPGAGRVEELEEDVQAVSTGQEIELRLQMDGGGRGKGRGVAAAAAAAADGTARSTRSALAAGMAASAAGGGDPEAAAKAKKAQKMKRAAHRNASRAANEIGVPGASAVDERNDSDSEDLPHGDEDEDEKRCWFCGAHGTTKKRSTAGGRKPKRMIKCRRTQPARVRQRRHMPGGDGAPSAKFFYKDRVTMSRVTMTVTAQSALRIRCTRRQRVAWTPRPSGTTLHSYVRGCSCRGRRLKATGKT